MAKEREKRGEDPIEFVSPWAQKWQSDLFTLLPPIENHPCKKGA